MSRQTDPLLERRYAERLHYATGELLGADDFQDEQTYHRRKLAQALLHLHGSGAVSGLRVTVTHQPGTPDQVELAVEPGLAIDKAGRLIEVPRRACLRLRRWFDYGAAQSSPTEELTFADLRDAWRTVGPAGAVVADVFLTFHSCDRGYTPAFASGPFDALDASQPSRVRDAYDLTLVTRPEANPPAPADFDPWSAISGATVADRIQSARTESLDAWDARKPPPSDHQGDWQEVPAKIDPTSVLLARLSLPATAPPNAASPPQANWTAAAWSDPTLRIDNSVRMNVMPNPALVHVINL